MDLERFYIDENSTIQFNNYKITVRRYITSDKSEYVDSAYYVVDANEFKTNYVAKHALLEIIAEEEFDTTDYAWLEGITVQTNDEVSKIYSCGSLEAYEASLESANDAYLMDLDYRISKLELGI